MVALGCHLPVPKATRRLRYARPTKGTPEELKVKHDRKRKGQAWTLGDLLPIQGPTTKSRPLI